MSLARETMRGLLLKDLFAVKGNHHESRSLGCWISFAARNALEPAISRPPDTGLPGTATRLRRGTTLRALIDDTHSGEQSNRLAGNGQRRKAADAFARSAARSRRAALDHATDFARDPMAELLLTRCVAMISCIRIGCTASSRRAHA